mmetsp:Transcript_30210/g.71131  ORF Transcript_30210/g.71131 Transcript_30210/m.71131 type:complete len:419 (+) Transcript_30210:28-1284(+)
MAERSRSPRREKYLWVKVKGGVRPIKINITELHDVDALLEAVKNKVKPDLNAISLQNLQLFESEKAKDGGSEALQPDLRVAEITGGEEIQKPLYVFFPDADVATASQASEWYNVTGVLSGWGRQFGARRGLFHNAAQAEARGAQDKCIVHMGGGNIQLNLWFQSEGQLQKFDAALAVSAEMFGNHTMKLERKKASPPTPHPASVFASDYNSGPDSPEQHAKSDSGAGATAASGMRKRLENQRVAVTSEMTYKNMHIIPVALLQDNRKLTCRWLFLAGSGEFHDWFDGPEKAPHIRVTIDKETLSTYVGEKEFTLKVDTSRVGSKATITKPDSAMELPDGTGYMTTVRIPSVQADNFRLALSWRANCVDEAWKRVAADLPVNTNDVGGHGWWRCVDLGDDLLSAIEAAKVSLGGGSDEA